MAVDLAIHTHLEAVMGTVVGFASPEPLPAPAVANAARALHRADRVFSTWDRESPISKLRSGRVAVEELDRSDAALVDEVLALCAVARDITGGAFDPWAMAGGVDPTGLVKGWAAQWALSELTTHGAGPVMVNAGGDIALAGRPGGRPWRIGIRHPWHGDSLTAVVEMDGSLATSGEYERPGQLIDPDTGRPARTALSATVTGPDLALADALATGLAVGGASVLASIDALDGYEAHLVTSTGRHFATAGMPFAPA